MTALDQLHRILRERFGHREFRPAQLEVVGRVAAGRSTLALFPTAAGKSLCYQLPALILPGATIVVSPLLALMKDQVDACRAAGLPAARIDSTMTPAQTARVFERVRSGAVKILYVSPERAVSGQFVDRLAGSEVSLLAVDEAHTISAWGANFRPEFLRLPEAARALAARCVLLLTATATPEVVADIRRAFGLEARDTVATSVHRPNLTLEFRPTAPWDRDEVLAGMAFDQPAIVYATSRRQAGRLAEMLAARGHDARAYHAALDQDERLRVQEWFKGARRGVVCATISFGLGVDKGDVARVVHYDLPRSVEGYAQEIGRAGRDGCQGVCTLLGTLDDVPAIANFAYRVTPPRTTLEHIATALLDRTARFCLDRPLLARAAGVDEAVLSTIIWQLGELAILAEESSTPGLTLSLLDSPGRILDRFDGAERQAVARLLADAWPGKDGYFIAEDARETSRASVRTALSLLVRNGLARAGAASSRTVYSRAADAPPAAAVAGRLAAFFAELERRDVARTRMVVDFVESAACHADRLTAHFGQRLEAPCGACTWCRTGEAVYLKRYTKRAPTPDRAHFDAFRALHPAALGEPRMAARFLFGMSSRAVEAAGLDEHPAWGMLRGHDFAEILAWLEAPRHGPAAPVEMFEAFSRGAAARREKRAQTAVALAARRARRTA